MRLNLKANLIIFLIYWSIPAFAQEENDITIPSSPAFSILNFEPTSVLRPGSPKELTTDILNSFDQEGKLRLNIGLEVGPYWLKSRPYLTREQYLKPSIAQSFLQSLLLSAATVKDTVSGRNKLGTGVRFKLIAGEVTEEYNIKEKELKAVLNIIGAIATTKVFIGDSINSREAALDFITQTLNDAGYSEEVINSFRIGAEERSINFDDTSEGINKFVEDLSNLIDSNSKELKIKVAELSRKRVGNILEVAAASSFITTPQNKEGALERFGVWLTYSNYVTERDAFNLSLRNFYTRGDSTVTNFDFGISYIKEINNFSFALEGMGRWYRAEFPDININNEPIITVEKDWTYRFAVQSAYKISDDLSVNISLGKDFKSPTIQNGSYFSILGFNYSIFNKSKVNLAPTQ